MKVKGYALAIISASFYGLIPLFILPIKAIHFPLNTTLFHRFFLAALIILTFLIFKKEAIKVKTTECFLLMVLGLLYALSTDFLLLGYDALTPGIASTIFFVFPVIVAVIMTAFFKEKMNRTTGISLAICVAGVLVLGAQNALYNINGLGLAVSLLSAMFYALYIVIVNQSNIQVSGFKLTFYSLLFSSAYYGVKALVLNEPMTITNSHVLLNLVLLALVSTVLSIIALVYAIKFIGSTTTSILSAMEPLVAVWVSVSFFGEHLTLNLIIGMILIVVGVVLSILSGARSEQQNQ